MSFPVLFHYPPLPLLPSPPFAIAWPYLTFRACDNHRLSPCSLTLLALFPLISFHSSLEFLLLYNCTPVLPLECCRFPRRMEEVSEFSKFHKLPRDLEKEVRRYFEHRYAQMLATDIDSDGRVLDSLTTSLKDKVMTHILADSVEHIGLVTAVVDEGDIRSIADFRAAVYDKLKSVAFSRDDICLQAGSVDELFFVRRGVVAAFSHHAAHLHPPGAGGNRPMLYFLAAKGSALGAGCLLDPPERSPEYRARAQCDLWCLSRLDLLSLADEHLDTAQLVELAQAVLSEMVTKCALRVNGFERLERTSSLTKEGHASDEGMFQDRLAPEARLDSFEYRWALRMVLRLHYQRRLRLLRDALESVEGKKQPLVDRFMEDQPLFAQIIAELQPESWVRGGKPGSKSMRLRRMNSSKNVASPSVIQLDSRLGGAWRGTGEGRSIEQQVSALAEEMKRFSSELAEISAAHPYAGRRR